MDLGKMLYQMHVQMTVTNPITRNVFDVPTYDFEKIDQVIFDKAIKECYKKYQETETRKKYGYGSVDINPSQWALFYLETMENAQNEGAVEAGVPNGCCTMDHCGICVFYGLLNEYFKGFE